MSKFFRVILGTVVSIGGIAASTQSQAVSAFARQTGMACEACHTQSFPALNAFGRSFKGSGYRLIGKEEEIKSIDLGLPVVLNASLVSKFRYQKTNGADPKTGTNTGELQFPDEAALLIGGRAGEHIGFLTEIATFGTADTNSGDFSLIGGFKIIFHHEMGGTDFGFIPFTTDGGGAGYGMELLNTGAMRSQRVGEERKALMAQQYLGLGAGTAEGFAFTAANPMGFVNVTLWAPKQGTFAVKRLAPYVRAAVTPSIGGWDTGLGVQYYSGKATERDTSTGLDVDHVTKGWAIDGQLQGAVRGMPVNVYAAYGNAPKGTIFNSGNADKKAWSVHTQIGVLPRMALLAGYLSADTGAATNNRDNALTLGGTYMFAQNVQLQLSHIMFSGSKYNVTPKAGDQRTMLMLFSAF